MIAALVVSSIVHAALPKERKIGAPLKIFEVGQGHHSHEFIRIETRKIDGSEVETLSYLVGARLAAQLVLPATSRAKILADFETAFPLRVRLRLQSVGPCGQAFSVFRKDPKEKRESLCLDTLPAPRQAALAKWWRETRTTLGL